MGFLSKTSKATINLQLQVDQATAQQVANDLTVIVAKLSASEISVLRKLAEKPLIKKMALEKAQEFI